MDESDSGFIPNITNSTFIESERKGLPIFHTFEQALCTDFGTNQRLASHLREYKYRSVYYSLNR
jgi:hypothetical protein